MTATPTSPGTERTMIGSENGQDRFIEIRRDGAKLYIREGKVGVVGVRKVTEYPDEGRAGHAFAIMVSESTHRGFRQVR